VCHGGELGASWRAIAGVYVRMYLEGFHSAFSKYSWKCTQIELGIMLRAYLGAYSQAGWECVIK